MDLIHIFFKELEIHQDNTFTANVSQENEVENVVFYTDTEYAVTGMVIKPDIADCKLVKIKNTNEWIELAKRYKNS